MSSARTALALCSMFALGAATLVTAQSGASSSGQSAPAGAAAPSNPAIAGALANLQLELNALNSMNDAAADQMDGAEQRIQYMTAFVKSKELDAKLGDFSKSWKMAAPPLSFQQAYTSALQAERLRGPVTITETDFDTLTREVTATTTMVQQRWTKFNGLRSDVQRLSDFLTAQHLMDDYHDFADARAAAEKSAADAQAAQNRAKAEEAGKKQDAARQAALTYLQKQWDSQSHLNSSGTNYNYTFSQTPSTTYAGDQGSPPINPYPYPYASPDYWGGTYWNGYADPYHDVRGYPGGAGGRGAAYQRSGGGGSGGGRAGGGGGGRR